MINKITNLINYEISLYPKAQLQDFYKLFFQDFFGPGHFIKDSASVKKYLDTELLEYTRKTPKQNTQNIACINNFLRVDICVVNENVSREDFIDIFIKSSRIKLSHKITWQKQWQIILGILLDMKPEFSTELELINRLAKESEFNSAIHHSEIYRKLYQPHYRLMSETLWQETLNKSTSP